MLIYLGGGDISREGAIMVIGADLILSQGILVESTFNSSSKSPIRSSTLLNKSLSSSSVLPDFSSTFCCFVSSITVGFGCSTSIFSGWTAGTAAVGSAGFIGSAGFVGSVGFIGSDFSGSLICTDFSGTSLFIG